MALHALIYRVPGFTLLPMTNLTKKKDRLRFTRMLANMILMPFSVALYICFSVVGLALLLGSVAAVLLVLLPLVATIAGTFLFGTCLGGLVLSRKQRHRLKKRWRRTRA